MAVCIPPVFEVTATANAWDCLQVMPWLNPPNPACVGSGCPDDSCCEPDGPPPGWQECPDGFEPDWCDRLKRLQIMFPFLACATPEQLEIWWGLALCLMPKRPCMCEELRSAILQSLILHEAEIHLQLHEAMQLSQIAGARRGYMRPVLPVTSAMGGSVKNTDAVYHLTYWGLRYLALKAASKRDITGIYYGQIKVGGGRHGHRM